MACCASSKIIGLEVVGLRLSTQRSSSWRWLTRQMSALYLAWVVLWLGVRACSSVAWLGRSVACCGMAWVGRAILLHSHYVVCLLAWLAVQFCGWAWPCRSVAWLGVLRHYIAVVRCGGGVLCHAVAWLFVGVPCHGLTYCVILSHGVLPFYCMA